MHHAFPMEERALMHTIWRRLLPRTWDLMTYSPNESAWCAWLKRCLLFSFLVPTKLFAPNAMSFTRSRVWRIVLHVGHLFSEGFLYVLLTLSLHIQSSVELKSSEIMICETLKWIRHPWTFYIGYGKTIAQQIVIFFRYIYCSFYILIFIFK